MITSLFSLLIRDFNITRHFLLKLAVRQGSEEFCFRENIIIRGGGGGGGEGGQKLKIRIS